MRAVNGGGWQARDGGGATPSSPSYLVRRLVDARLVGNHAVRPDARVLVHDRVGDDGARADANGDLVGVVGVGVQFFRVGVGVWVFGSHSTHLALGPQRGALVVRLVVVGADDHGVPDRGPSLKRRGGGRGGSRRARARRALAHIAVRPLCSSRPLAPRPGTAARRSRCPPSTTPGRRRGQ